MEANPASVIAELRSMAFILIIEILLQENMFVASPPEGRDVYRTTDAYFSEAP
jgi:hypothetical protein